MTYFDDVYVIFFLIFYIKAYIMGTHLNCIDKYSGSNLKTTELLDCALIGVCAVIRANTVLKAGNGTMIEGIRRKCRVQEP